MRSYCLSQQNNLQIRSKSGEISVLWIGFVGLMFKHLMKDLELIRFLAARLIHKL